MFDDYFEQAQELIRQGVPFATATVVRAEKPTSGKPGDRAIVTLDGVMSGWIGGSCAQPTVVTEAMEAIAQDRSRLIRLSPEEGENKPRDGVIERPMTCFSGGTLEIFIEPHAPRPQLLIVGNLPVARALVQLGKAMSYRTLAVVPQDADGAVAMEHADEQVASLDDLASRVTPLTFAVVASHGHGDREALAAILRTQVPYVGLVASRRRGAELMDQLRQDGFDDHALRRLKAPAGLDIGARRGDEIALSIMAEVIQAHRGAERFAWASREEVEAEAATATCCGSGSVEEADDDPVDASEEPRTGCCGGS